MSPSKQTIALLALAACSVLGSPVAKPQMVFAPAYCKVDYTVDEQHKKTDVAGITGDYTVSGGMVLNLASLLHERLTKSGSRQRAEHWKQFRRRSYRQRGR